MNKIIFSSSKTLASALSLFLVILLALRFHNIFNIGVNGADTFYYWQTALEWMRGEIPDTEHFRPFIYWLYSKLFLITGPNDWIISSFNVFCDALVAILLAYFGQLLRRSWILGLVASLSYLSLYLPLISARAELVHAPSAIFLMLSVMFLFHWVKNLKSVFIFFSGLFLSMAWHTHPDLAVLGAPYTLIILIKLLSSNKIDFRIFWKKTISQFLCFLLGFFSLFILFSFKLGLTEMIQSLLVNHGTQSKMVEPFIKRFFSTTVDYTIENLGPFLSIFIFPSLAIYVWKIKKRRVTIHDSVLLLLPFFYLFFCALLFSRYHIPRLFIPLAPLVCLFICLQAYDFLRGKKILNLILVLICFGSLSLNKKTIEYPLNQPVSIYKKIENAYKDILKGDEKYLIAPLSIFHIHAPLSREVYLGGRGLYLVSTTETSLDDVILQNKIKYVWIADVLYDSNVMNAYFKLSYAERLKNLFDMDREEYTLKKEKSRLKEMLNKRGAKVIHKSELGEVYEL